ncbi:YtxH-like protein [Pricia antarctica]|uniref:YtxH-like protein n=1 Tax=Pricia antarctica TaxID=641691 RepID=A0A1G7EBM9_9FLAO|nr:YtxH domain-containing protein [Pricia antarctica]SDE60785.1 YtxH-like protein [Pricia antarctica]
MGKTETTGKIFMAVLAGAAIGATVAVLYAPESGKVTRTKIKDEAVKGSEEIASRVRNLTDSAKQDLSESGDSLSYLVVSAVVRTIFNLEKVVQIVKDKLSEMVHEAELTKNNHRIIELPSEDN